MNLREMFKKIHLPINLSNIAENSDKTYDELSEDEFQSLMADSSDPTTITVEVAYLTSENQLVLEVQVPRGANIEDGIVLSGLLEQCDEVDLAVNKVGLYGVIKLLSEVLSDGDRIEIYRPITAKE